MSAGGIDHVLLTRFNVPTPGPEALVRAQEGWLRRRVALFDRYCLPSVIYQGDADARWIVYLDPHSPAWLMDWVHERATDGRFLPVLRERVTAADRLDDLHRVLGGPPRAALLTTNLDNDDALSADLLHRLRRRATAVQATWGDAPPPRPVALYAPVGLVRRAGRVYRRRDPRNAFCSVLEDWSDPVTCWADWHDRLHLVADEVLLDDAPGWLQVVHGTNVSNRVQGRLVDPASARESFPTLLDDVPAPGARARAVDTCLARPARAVREAARGAAKRTLLAAVGRDGLTAAKDRLARLSPARRRGGPAPAARGTDGVRS